MILSTCHPNRKIAGRGLCKNCYDKWLKDNNPIYKQKQLDNKNSWYQRNKEKQCAYERERNKKRSKDPNYKEHRRKQLLWKNYKITLEQYNQMLQNQNFSCKLCFRKEGKFKFHVDHCHKTNRVRGILCHQCNWYLGTIEEDTNIIKRINNYLGLI